MEREDWLRIAERMATLGLAVLVPVAGGLWAVYVYTQNQADVAAKQTEERSAQTRARLVELQKPFIDQQFQTYKEFTTVVGELLVFTGDNEAWRAKMFQYWRLHWGPVALVEDEVVHQAKARYGESLKTYSTNGNDATYKTLTEASVVLTTAMRRGIQSSWTTGELGARK